MTHPRQLARLLAGAIVCLFAVTWLESPLRAPAGRRLQMLAGAPQFWGYFAAPLQDRMELFRLRGGTWVRADVPQGSPRNLFGFTRGPVLHSSELRALLRDAPLEWSEGTLREGEVPGLRRRAFRCATSPGTRSSAVTCFCWIAPRSPGPGPVRIARSRCR